MEAKKSKDINRTNNTIILSNLRTKFWNVFEKLYVLSNLDRL